MKIVAEVMGHKNDISLISHFNLFLQRNFLTFRAASEDRRENGFHFPFLADYLVSNILWFFPLFLQGSMPSIMLKRIQI